VRTRRTVSVRARSCAERARRSRATLKDTSRKVARDLRARVINETGMRLCPDCFAKHTKQLI